VVRLSRYPRINPDIFRGEQAHRHGKCPRDSGNSGTGFCHVVAIIYDFAAGRDEPPLLLRFAAVPVKLQRDK
jgi:hypothetical protein